MFWGPAMKDIYALLRQKELAISRLETEVEALRVVAPLLSEDHEAGDAIRPAATRSTTSPPVQVSKPADSFP
jgi:hypothetical protein